MGSYYLFTDYLRTHYESEMNAAIENFIIENPDNLKSKVIKNLTGVECENFSFKKTWIRNLPGLQLEFDVAVEAELLLEEYTCLRTEEDSVSVWLLIKGSVDFENICGGLYIDDVSEYEIGYFADSSYTDSLIPCIDETQTEKIAVEFLKTYYPEALISPCPVNVDILLKRMNLNVAERHLSDDASVFGEIVFRECDVDIYPDNSGIAIKERISANTVLYDERVFFLRNYGSVRHTIVHECLHSYLHKKTFLIAEKLREASSGFKCLITGEMKTDAITTEAWYMEWQANKIASKVLAPKDMLLKKTSEIREKTELENPHILPADLMQSVIRRVANYFGISIQTARIRLVESGCHEASGVLDYCNGHYLQPYKFRKDALQKDETYTIGFHDFIVETFKNPELSELFSTGNLVYIDAHVCVNSDTYIEKSGDEYVLSEYARMNIDECCLKFTIDTCAKHSGRGFYRECVLCKDMNTGVTPVFQYSAEANASVTSKARAILKDQRARNEVRSKISESLPDTLKELMKWADMSVAKLSKDSGVDEKTIQRLRTGETECPTIETLVALAIALNLPYDTAIELLRISSHVLMRSKNEHLLYDYFLKDGCCMTVQQCNEMLISMKYSPLTK